MTRTPEARETIARYQALRSEEKRERKASKPARVEKVGQEPRQRDNEHLKRIRRLPRLATLILTGREIYGVDAAHVRANYPVKGWGGNPGLGSKPHDWRTLPLVRGEHRRQHDMNEMAFWRDLGVYPPAVCGSLRDCATFDDMLAVIRFAASDARGRL